MQQAIAFTKTKMPHGWLGNMAAYPLQYGGKDWRTSEALFQSLRFKNEAVIEEIRHAESPMNAKFIAKRNKAQITVAQHGDLDLANMESVLHLKLDQHPELKEKLLDTGDAQIIEDCTRRQGGSGLIWGAALKEGQWVGENHLGKLWMKLRVELRSN